MPYTITQTAKAVDKDKTTLLRAIRSGKISATRDTVTRSWLIEPAELHRVYPVTADSVADAVQRSGDITSHAAVEIRELRARLADKDTVIEDLRRRLDAEAEERRQTQARLTALLADQRSAPPALTAALLPAKRSWWAWSRRA